MDNLFEQSINAILEIRDSRGVLGTGFVIDNDEGYAITAAHVVENCEKGSLFAYIGKDSKPIFLDVVYCGNGNTWNDSSGVEDLALLHFNILKCHYRPASLNWGETKVGEQLIVIGNSLTAKIEESGKSGTGDIASNGIRAHLPNIKKAENLGLNRVGKNQVLNLGDCSIDHGDSGGPVLNSEGDVVGVVSSGLKGWKFVIPSELAKDFVERARKEKGLFSLTPEERSELNDCMESFRKRNYEAVCYRLGVMCKSERVRLNEDVLSILLPSMVETDQEGAKSLLSRLEKERKSLSIGLARFLVSIREPNPDWAEIYETVFTELKPWEDKSPVIICRILFYMGAYQGKPFFNEFLEKSKKLLYSIDPDPDDYVQEYWLNNLFSCYSGNKDIRDSLFYGLPEEILVKAVADDAESQFRMGEFFNHSENGLPDGQYSAYYVMESGGSFKAQKELPSTINRWEEYWYTKAARKNHIDAIGALLGLLVANGRMDDAALWSEKLRSLGDHSVDDLLFLYYMSIKDRTKVLPIIEDAISRDSKDAEVWYGLYYLLGDEADRYEKARYWFELAAKKGNAQAEYNLGSLYLNGWGVDVDEKKAFELINKAAEKGFSLAQYQMGYFYKFGTECDVDLKKAAFWFESAIANAGDILMDKDPAQHALGTLYVENPDVFEPEKYQQRAIDLIRESAEDGYPQGMCSLGFLIMEGYLGTVGHDEIEHAFDLFHKAASKGLAEAKYKLGYYNLYADQYGGESNVKEAYRWLDEAAQEGHAEAEFQCGVMLMCGYWADPRYMSDGSDRIRKAAEEGSESAIGFLNGVGSRN